MGAYFSHQKSIAVLAGNEFTAHASVRNVNSRRGSTFAALTLSAEDWLWFLKSSASESELPTAW
jgi:hypothetical protein